MELEFDVKIDGKILYDFSLRHFYTSFAGIFGTVIAILMLVGFVSYHYVTMLIAGVVLLLYLPWTLFLRSRKQALNPVFKQPLHYRMTEEGVYISQGETEEFQKWEDMYKAVSTGKSIILYTSAINASIFPRADLKEKETAVIEAIHTHMPPGKIKIKF